jgi:hypothetical protein
MVQDPSNGLRLSDEGDDTHFDLLCEDETRIQADASLICPVAVPIRRRYAEKGSTQDIAF